MRVEGRTAVDRHGRVAARHAFPQYVTAWTRVFNPLRAAFPAARYRGGRELVALEQDDAGIAARFADGGVERADLLVGADGFRSTVRGLVAPAVAPRYAGYVAWRAMVEEAAFSPAFRDTVFDRFTFGFLPGSQFIGYPVPGRGESAEPGRRRYNFLWYYPVDPGAALADLLTDEAGHTHAWSIPPARMRAAHVAALRAAAAAGLPPPYGEAVERSDGFLMQPIYDLEGEAIAFGRVALLGDAAFVARPHVGVGVLKAAEDAQALAEALAEGGPVPDALARYAARRIPPGRAAVAAGRRLGAFIERRLDGPEADPALGLTLARVVEISGRPVQDRGGPTHPD